MVLKFNTFRAERYLRTRFLEGRFLLASENTDLQLEMLDRSRETIRTTLGDVAIEDGWKVEKYKISTTVTNVAGTTLTLDTSVLDLAIIGDEVLKNSVRIEDITNIDLGANTITLPSIGSIGIGDTIEIKVRNTVLIRHGEARYDGLPFIMQGGQDASTSGSNRPLGITVAVGGGSTNVTAQDEPNGLGKLLNFNDGGTTPAGLYRVVISALEEVVTNIEDPFIKNANIAESTGQKIRLIYRINIVPESAQSETPIPYTDSTTDGNLVNKITVTPTSGGEGSEASRTTITGAEEIDGRNIEINIRNTAGSNKLPAGSVEQAEYTNGKFIDSLGNEYHLNLITNATVANQVTLRIDKAPTQPDPVIINNVPYTLIKRDVIVTDDANGNPQGQLFFPVATVNVETGIGIAHPESVTDLRESIISKEAFEDLITVKTDIKLTDGGDIDFEVTDVGGNSDDILHWDDAFTLINPHGPVQTIPTNTVALLEGASVAYYLQNEAGGALAVGNQALTSEAETAGETTIELQNNPNLELIKKGNMVRIADETRYILEIDDVNKTITINSGISGNILAGTAVTVYRDTYAQGLTPLEPDIFVLATRNNDKVYFSNLELSSGETSNIGSSIPQALLDYIGSPAENDSTPDYTSPQVTTITLGAPATINDSEYFYITGGQSGDRHYVWFDKSGAAVDPNPAAGDNSVEVDISAAVTDEDVAEAVRTELDGLADFTAVRNLAEVTVTDVVDGANEIPNNVNLGSPFEITALVGSPSVVTDGTSLTQGIVDLDKGLKDVDNILDQPIYEEDIYYAGGLAAFTSIDLPLNTRNFDKPQQLVAASGALEVYVNSRLVREPEDYIIFSESGGAEQQGQIRFTFDLPADTTVVFRLDSLGGSTSSVVSLGTGDAWSDPVDSSIIPDTNNAYDLGSGALKFRDGYFAGDVSIDGKLTVIGIIDPTGLELTPQGSDPFSAGQAGIYIDSGSGGLIYRKADNTTSDFSSRLDDLESGASNPITGGDGLTKTGNDLSVNVDGTTIEIDTDVLQIVDGGIDTLQLADAGVTEAKLNASVAGNGLGGGAGSPLEVNVDGSTIEIATDTLQIVDAGVDETKLASSVAGDGLSGGAGSALAVNVDASTIVINTDTLEVGVIGASNVANNIIDENMLTTSVAGDGLAGGNGTPLSVNVDGQTLQIIGDTLSVIGADSLTIQGTAGEAFAADTTFLVRWAVDGETAGRLYKADSADAESNAEFTVVGLVNLASSVVAGDPIDVLVKGSNTLGASDSSFNAADIGKLVYLTDDGAFSVTAPTDIGDAQYVIGFVEDTDKLFLDSKYLRSIVPEPIYDERELFPSGLSASTVRTLPNNTRSGLAQTYTVGSGELKIYINQKLAFAGVEYSETSSTQITFNIALANDTEVHYRIEQQGSGVLAGAGGGGSDSLQTAYNNGRTITVTTGNPIEISGPAAEKLFIVNGDIEVTGVIDPAGIELTPQASNPLGAGQAGIFVEQGSNDLCFEDGQGGSKNITQSIVTLENNVGVVTRLNNTGSQIDAYTPVFAPVAGEIEPADGTDDTKFRVIGITAENIPDGQSGEIYTNGSVLPGVTGLTHGSLVYLGTTIGSLTDDASSFPMDFNIVRLGVIDGTNLFVQIEQLGSTAS